MLDQLLITFIITVKFVAILNFQDSFSPNSFRFAPSMAQSLKDERIKNVIIWCHSFQMNERAIIMWYLVNNSCLVTVRVNNITQSVYTQWTKRTRLMNGIYCVSSFNLSGNTKRSERWRLILSLSWKVTLNQSSLGIVNEKQTPQQAASRLLAKAGIG